MAEMVMFPSVALATSQVTPKPSTMARPSSVSKSVVKQGMQVDVELHLPVQRLWDSLRDMNRVAPMIPLNFKHKQLKGDGGVGSVSMLQFSDGLFETELLEEVDDVNHTLVSTVFSHQPLMDGYQEYTKTVFLSPARGGASTIARWRAEYAPVAERNPTGSASDSAFELFKAMEAHYIKTQAKQV